MDVKDDSKFGSTYKNRAYRFCSASCKQSFDKEPEKYAKGA